MEFEVDLMDMLIKDEITKLRKKFEGYGSNIDTHIDVAT